MKKLIKMLKDKEQEILNQEYKHISKLNYFKEIYEILNKKNKNFYSQIDNCDFFALVLDMLNKEYCINPILIWDLNYVNSYNVDDLDELLIYLQNHIDKNGKNVKDISIPKKIVANQNVFTDAECLAMYLTILKDFFPDNVIDNELNTALIAFTLFKDDELEDDETMNKLNKHSRKTRRVITKGINLNSSTSYPTLDKILKKLIVHYETMDKEYIAFERQKRKSWNKLNHLINTLNTMLHNPYITLTTDLNKLVVDNPEIKKEVYRIILEHNEKSYFKLQEENNINNNNSISQLEKLFFDYNINPKLLTSDDRIKLLQTKSIGELKDILEILKTPLFSFLKISNPYFINILLYSNTDILNEIKIYYKNGIIRQNFLEKNIKILIPDDANINGQYYILKENIKTLDKYHLKWNLISEDEMNFILFNPERLKNILSSLNKYFHPFNQESCYFFLENPELIDYIDSYIEFGEYELLVEQPEILTKNDVFKRIIIAKNLNEEILTEKKYIRNDILTGKNFYVNNNDIDEYIIIEKNDFIDHNAENELNTHEHFAISPYTLEVEEIVNLDERFKINELMYNFNGIIISRIKVLRCFEFLSHGNYNVNNNLFSSIIYNSVLSEDEINQIKNLLFGRKL